MEYNVEESGASEEFQDKMQMGGGRSRK